jgi:hypothetical protein
VEIQLKDSWGTVILDEQIVFDSEEGDRYRKYRATRSETRDPDEVYVMRVAPDPPCEWLELLVHLEIKATSS